MNGFNIGDRVRVKDYTEVSEAKKAKSIKDRPYMWNTGKAKIAGKEGVVVDKLYSEAHSRFIYFLHLDGYDNVSNAQFDADSLELIVDEPVTYCYEFEFLETLVVARFCEVRGGEKTELAKGHGHIFHDGAYGIAQASSYALKKIMEKMEAESND